ncbi:MAG: acyl-CoA dehydrogenase [Acidimicrobiaceae bacterium]|nr:acyl-CoA dehydrogenase [Acidimicrobiaceae bacterium]
MAPETADRLATVIQPGRRFAIGEALPALWHWAYFPDLTAGRDLGPDGHPRRFGELAMQYPRRMAGGGSVLQAGGLVIGEPAERHAELIDCKERHGRSGDIVICDWRHLYVQEGVERLEEHQTVIYRRAAVGRAPEASKGDRVASPGSPDAPPDNGGVRFELVRRVDFDPVGLFRFSAVTWNSHRIHYDRAYVTEKEGYPGLVVHGPLLTMLLAGEAERALGTVATMEFRSLSPVFDSESVEIFLSADKDGSCRVEARKVDGTVATSLSASAPTR